MLTGKLCVWVRNLANVTVSVPEELKKRMEHMKAVNWSEVARKRLRRL